MRRLGILPALAIALCAAPATAQRPADHGTAVIVFGQEATLPVPLYLRGKANQDAADLMYLRLARVGSDLVTSGDRGFEPELARSWARRDSVTLAFELDPRARWHDGRSVSARDVVFSFERARDGKTAPQHTVLLRRIESVAAEGDHQVVIRFTQSYGEQLYDATRHVQILPAHLLESLPADQIPGSSFAQRPVGNGPYRFVRRDPGRQMELAAVPEFFLGAPRIDRVVLLLARDPEAQLNLILDGTADALESISPISNIPRVEARGDYRLVPVPTFILGYLLFNHRAYGDRSAPHPILADVEVRRALAMGLDRTRMVRATFGNYSAVPQGPVAQLHWIRDPDMRSSRYDPAAAGRLLDARGWRDSDRDGIRDRDGHSLTLRLSFPGTSSARVHLAAQVQEQLRGIGVGIELVRLDGPVWAERRNRGEFDIDFSSASMDPSPGGLTQSWSCAGLGGSNVAQYCNPRVDSLMASAILATGDAREAWRRVLLAINADAPAVFMFAPTNVAVIHRRYDNVTLRPESMWSSLWRWRVTPGRQIARDRGSP